MAGWHAAILQRGQRPTDALVFADRLPAHFRGCGVNLVRRAVQTDGGSECGSNEDRRHVLPAFTELVE